VVNSVIVIIKVAAILLLVVACVKYINPANWHPFVPPNTGESGSFGWSGVFRGAAVVFFAYIGFDGVSTLAEEARDPKRTVPISLFAALAICTALYIAMSLVITGLGDYHQLNVPDPVYKALDLAHANLQWLKYTVATVAVIGMVSVILLSLLGQVRILFAMGRDGLLPPIFARCSERFNTPHIGTIITGTAAALFAAFLPLDILNDLISIGTLLAFALVCLGIIVLRAKRPDAPRPFRTPLVPLVPLLGAGTCFFLMASLPLIAWERLVLWLALGFAIYFGYGRRHSKLAGK
jgi:APA family basic amino acid/polyamine antiporter